MEHKVVFITGCSSGIGRALSIEYHRRGFRVIATARNVDSLGDLQKKGITPYGLDVTYTDQIKRIARILKPSSWYRSIEESIFARAQLSQVNATPVEEFAKKFVAALMLDNPPDILRLGNKSRILPLMGTLLSTKLLDSIFKRKFGITNLLNKAGKRNR